MTMTKTMPGVLEFPSSYQVMDEQEMTYVEGGLSVAVTTAYQNKSTCLAYGNAHVGYLNMTALEIAQEVYAHAEVYYFAEKWKDAMLKTGGNFLAMFGVAQFLSDRTRSVEVGETGFRALILPSVYKFIWNR